MRSWMIAFSLGIILSGFIPSIPSLPQICLCLIIPLLSLRFKNLGLTSAFILGIFIFLLWAQDGVSKIIPAELENEDTWVIGKVISLPQQAERSQRFEFVVTKTQQKLLLNIYDNLLIKPNQVWQLKVRLKQPHGFANPGGFDYEGWLFQKKISATGYVRSDANNRLIKDKSSFFNFQSLRYQLRERLQALFQEQPLKNLGLIKALSIGDRYQISDKEWALFSATGTNHLIVISGLHVGLVALMAYRLSIFLLSFSTRLLLRIPAKRLGALIAIVVAFVYAGLAGFSLPSTRAFIMVFVFMLGQCLCRQTSVSNSFCLALALVLSIEPLAPQSSGFWLSFGAVGVLIFFISQKSNEEGKLRFWDKSILLIKTQGLLFVGLFPLMLLFFHQVSLLAPLVNILAIPFVSLFIVPLCLLGLLFLFWIPALSVWFFKGADLLLEVFKQSLNLLTDFSASPLVSLPTLSISAYLLLLLGTLCLLCLPTKTKLYKALKLLSLLFFIPLFFPTKTELNNGEFTVDILDVGQGLAMVVSTQNHHLIYDTGPQYSDRFNAGSGLLIPFIRAKNIPNVDKVIVSHGDNDHSGGLSALLTQFPKAEYLSSDLSLFGSQSNKQYCQAGKSWLWDEVLFEFLHPDDSTYDSNNSSCVLKISIGESSVLLTGDIEGPVERKLLRLNRDKLQANILIAPHHGSQTSSTASFVKAVAPDYVIFSSGYLNRFNHPHPKVRARYADSAVQTLNTARTGAISFKVSREMGVSSPEIYRDVRKRYWSAFE